MELLVVAALVGGYFWLKSSTSKWPTGGTTPVDWKSRDLTQWTPWKILECFGTYSSGAKYPCKTSPEIAKALSDVTAGRSVGVSFDLYRESLDGKKSERWLTWGRLIGRNPKDGLLAVIVTWSPTANYGGPVVGSGVELLDEQVRDINVE